MEYSDIINNLKTDKEQPTSEEIIILDKVFNEGNLENKKNFSALFSEFKEVILILVLFILFSLTQTDNIIKKIIPKLENSNLYLTLFKGFLFITIFWIIKNFYLIKK
jgi:hypothetical protein